MYIARFYCYYNLKSKNTPILCIYSVTSSGLALWFVTVQPHNSTQQWCQDYLGDVDCQDRLAMLVFGFTHVVSKVDGLHVLYCEDAL